LNKLIFRFHRYTLLRHKEEEAMKGRKPDEYKLNTPDRRYLQEIARDGQLIQRVANRARALLALDRGERIVEILRWVGVSRGTLWYLWQRYLERGVEAIFDEERSGRPPVFSPSPARRD
jgi:hypothetical protein